MRYLLFMLLLVAVSTAPVTSANASGYCPGQSGGKCPVKKKISRNRSDFSQAQRDKFMEAARSGCKKKYGSTSRVYKLDYKKWTVTCTE